MSGRVGRRGLRVAGASVAVVAAGAVGWWAAWTALEPGTADRGGPAHPVTVDVVEGKVGRVLTVGVTVTQPVVVIASNLLSGVVTAVDVTTELHPGDRVYAVNSVDVRVSRGSTPYHRDLSRGSRGEDVRQLQQLLVDLGFLSATPNGTFGPATEQAVRAWQTSLTVPVTGTVPLGTLVAVPTLPGSLTLGDAIQTGLVVAGGEPAVLAPTGERVFSLVLSTEQAARIRVDTPVRVRHDEHVWESVIVSSATDQNGNPVFTLGGVDGRAVCGDACGSLPAQARVSLVGQAVITPELAGPVIPTAAVRTSNAGRAYVIMEDGSERYVTVLASDGGLAVVEGVEIGEQVRVGDQPADG
jgi:peptidoglycan hydrolase-like protein with peptidoglycan-binding domain